MAVIGEYAQRTGKKVLYAFNITDDMIRRDAPPPRCRARGGRHLRDGQPQLGWPCRARGGATPCLLADSRSSQRLRRLVTRADARLRLCRLAEILACPRRISTRF